MKQRLRRNHLEKRGLFSKEEVIKWSRKIQRRLFSHPQYKKSKSVLFYVSKGNEVNTLDMIEEALQEKEVVVPKTLPNKKTLLLSRINSLNDLEEGCFGIYEPKTVDQVALEDIELIIVPGIAFDNSGYRLGYGHGYYDRLLEKSRKVKIGLAFESQIVERIPRDKHDVKVDLIITEKRVIIFTSSSGHQPSCKSSPTRCHTIQRS